MAGMKGKSGPPGNMSAFKHGLAAIQKRREESIITEHEESIRHQILDGLIADKGGDQQVSTATRILAEVIAPDAAWLMVFNGAIDHIIQNNPKARQNPRGLSQLDGYKRGLVNSLTGNLQKFGLDRVPRWRRWKKFSARPMKPARIPPRIVQERRTSRAEVLNVLFDCRLPRSESRSVGTPSADARPQDYYPFLF